MLNAPCREPIDINRIGQVLRRLISQLSMPQVIQLVDHVLPAELLHDDAKPSCQPDAITSQFPSCEPSQDTCTFQPFQQLMGSEASNQLSSRVLHGSAKTRVALRKTFPGPASSSAGRCRSWQPITWP